jgi:hypothetical protein
MKHLFLFLLSTNLTAGLLAQDSLTYRPHYLNVRIQAVHGMITDGYLYAISDSALIVSKARRRPNPYDTTAREGMKAFGYQQLQFVTVHNAGGTGRSVLIGLAIGAATGAIAGFASGDDPKDQIIALTASEKALAVGIFGGTIGAITGLIIGVASHHTFVIRGRKERLNEMSRRLASRMGID